MQMTKMEGGTKAPIPKPMAKPEPKPAAKPESKPVVRINKADQDDIKSEKVTSEILKKTSTPLISPKVKELLAEPAATYVPSDKSQTKPVSYTAPTGPVKVTPTSENKLLNIITSNSTSISIASIATSLAANKFDEADNILKNASKNSVELEKKILAVDPKLGKLASDAKKASVAADLKMGNEFAKISKIATPLNKVVSGVSTLATVASIGGNVNEVATSKSEFNKSMGAFDAVTNTAVLAFSVIPVLNVAAATIGIGENVLTATARKVYETSNPQTQKKLDIQFSTTKDAPTLNFRKDGVIIR